jgi:hypothetical protein
MQSSLDKRNPFTNSVFYEKNLSLKRLHKIIGYKYGELFASGNRKNNNGKVKLSIFRTETVKSFQGTKGENMNQIRFLTHCIVPQKPKNRLSATCLYQLKPNNRVDPRIPVKAKRQGTTWSTTPMASRMVYA